MNQARAEAVSEPRVDLYPHVLTLTLSPATERWLRHGYEQRMGTEAVRRDLGEILAHGEPERGMGQREAAEQPDAQAFWDGDASPGAPDRPQEPG